MNDAKKRAALDVPASVQRDNDHFFGYGIFQYHVTAANMAFFKTRPLQCLNNFPAFKRWYNDCSLSSSLCVNWN